MVDFARAIATVAGTATTGTDWLQLKGCNVDQRNFFDVSVVFTGTGTVEVQRKRSGEADGAARTIESYTGDTEKIGEIHGRWQVRLIVTAHGGAGDIDLEITQA